MERATASTASGSRISAGPDETRYLGLRIGTSAEPGTVVALIGPLGAGKTHLTKGIAAGLGVQTVVNSPTFVLLNEHLGRLRLYHGDAYRLVDPEEAAAAGLFDDRMADGVTVIEWADRLDGWLPAERLEIRLAMRPGSPMTRSFDWIARGTAHERLAAEALMSS